jgi:hypothetical protein
MTPLAQLAKLEGGALYDGYGKPITPGAPEWEGRGGLVHALPYCELVVPRGQGHDGTADLIYALPLAGAMRAASLYIREFIAAVEREETIALHATTEREVRLFLAMAGSSFGGEGNA